MRLANQACVLVAMATLWAAMAWLERGVARRWNGVLGMHIGQGQAFLLIAGLTACIGARRGWAREIITCAFILSATVFLSLGGAALLSGFFAHGVVGTAYAHPLAPAYFGSGGGPYNPGVAPATTSDQSGATHPLAACVTSASTHLISNMVFFGACWLGYWAGSKYGPAPKSANHNFAGLIPGAINGAVITYYISNYLFAGQQVVIEGPSATQVSSSLLVVLAVGMLGMLALTFVASQKSKTGKAS